MTRQQKKQRLIKSYKELVIVFFAYLEWYERKCGVKTEDKDKWVTMNDAHVLIDSNTGEIKAGLDDKYKGQKLDDLKEKNAKPTKEQQAEIESKIKELDNIDFTKEATLPNLPSFVLQRYGLKDKPIKLKSNIIIRNAERHPDITEDDAKSIIGLSLYKPEKVFESDRNNYLCFISSVNDKRFSDVVLDIEENLTNYEIVHFYWLNNKKLKKIEKRDKEI